MSAFLCSSRHLSVMVNVARDFGLLIQSPTEGLTDAEHTFRTLAIENGLSLQARYGVHDGAAELVYLPDQPRGGIVECLKLIHCYAHQSCEHEGWQASSARAWTEALAGIIGGTRESPGYASAPWGI